MVSDIAPENVGNANTELIGRQGFYFATDPIEQFEGALAGGGLWLWTLPPAPEPPSEKAAKHQDGERSAKNKPGRDERVINRWRDIVQFFGD